MKSHTITVDIGPNGDVTIDVEGKKGKSCIDVTKSLEEALGASGLSRKPKAEMNEKELVITDKTKIGF